jgi:hypothetical protein
MQVIVQSKENKQINDIGKNKVWTNHQSWPDSAGLG